MQRMSIVLAAAVLACFAAQPAQALRYLGHHYENTTFTMHLHGMAPLRFWCGGDNQYPCGVQTGIRTAAELTGGSLPAGVHVTAIGDLEGTPDEAGDWSGTVKLPSYWVNNGGQIDEYGDMFVDFRIHVNYYCDTPNC